MSSYLIVGPPGVGKTTLLEELHVHGYSTLDADFDTQLCGWVDKATDRKVADWSPEQTTAPRGCVWGWDQEKMHEIVLNPPGEPFFFAGNSINVAKFYPLFSKVFALYVNDETLVKRLTSPRNNPHNYGQKPEQIAEALAVNNGFQERERARGAILLNAMGPISAIYNELIKNVYED